MPTYFVQISLKTSTSLPEDEIVNTLSFSGTGTGTTTDDGDAITTELETFYDGLASDNVLGDYWTDGFDVAIYEPNLGTGVVGPPVYFRTVTGLAGSGDTLPSEVSICVSFANSTATGVPAGRRRGRIFLGPIAVATLTGDNPPRLADLVPATILDRFVTLQTNLGASGLNGVIWSRTDNTVFFIDRSWVDNAYDTVRSRGDKATSRATAP